MQKGSPQFCSSAIQRCAIDILPCSEFFSFFFFFVYLLVLIVHICMRLFVKPRNNVKCPIMNYLNEYVIFASRIRLIVCALVRYVPTVPMYELA